MTCVSAVTLRHLLPHLLSLSQLAEHPVCKLTFGAQRRRIPDKIKCLSFCNSQCSHAMCEITRLPTKCNCKRRRLATKTFSLRFVSFIWFYQATHGFEQNCFRSLLVARGARGWALQAQNAISHAITTASTPGARGDALQSAP